MDRERQRCLAIVDFAMMEATPEQARILTRVRNMIANGAEPITFREQVEWEVGDGEGERAK